MKSAFLRISLYLFGSGEWGRVSHYGTQAASNFMLHSPLLPIRQMKVMQKAMEDGSNQNADRSQQDDP